MKVKKDKLSPEQHNSKDVVMGCVQALNAEDFEAARDFVSDDMSFVGVMGSRSGAEAYFDDSR